MVTWASRAGTLRRRLVGQSAVVLVLAHRGSPTPSRPENTVAAVAAALDGGADGVEIDVRLTADGILVCSHDPDLLRLAGTPLPVAGVTARVLRGNPLAGGHLTATLAEVLAAARVRGRPRVIVEAKPTGSEVLGVSTAEALHRLLAGAARGLDLAVSSFDPVLLGRIRRQLAGTAIRTALIGRPSDPATTVLRATLEGGHDELHAHVRSVRADPDVVAIAQRLGVSITCWTVNRRAHAQLLRQLGVDAVITDRPLTVASGTLAERWAMRARARA